MKDRFAEAMQPYKKRVHWPPYTYQDYPDVTSKSLISFKDFLETENTSGKGKELQPWIPFCDSKCTFCYFPTESFSEDRIGKYLTALKKALQMYAETRYIRTSVFTEIYFGGGTPNVLSSEQLIDLLSHCEKNFSISGDRLIKIAGCAHNFDEKKLKSVSDYGVNQIDLGIQTFDDKIRKILNLQASAGEVKQTIRTARRLGLYVSIDLMFNLPGQSMEVWRNDIQNALELDVESVDCYPLEVYPDTILARQLKSGQAPPIGDSDTEIKMSQEAYTMFTDSGYNPACHNRFSRVEEDFGEPCFEILGTGAGFFMGHLGKYSYMDAEPVKEYVDLVKRGLIPITKLLVQSIEDEMRKTMMRLVIRLAVDKNQFYERFGKQPEDVFPAVINKLKRKGLIEVDDREIRLTKLGDIWRYNVACEFGPRKKI